VVKAVSGVSLAVDQGATLGVVGESGSGKSVTFLSMMGLLDKRNADVSGSVVFDGRDMLTMRPSELREAVLLHQDVTRREARRRAIEMLKEVEIPRAEQRVDDYPHQFSGGMRQRVMIAMALINNPELVIADEPTTALDVTTQAQILRLMKRLQVEHQMAIVMITHDLGVVAELADDCVVMYGGRVVEQAKVTDLFAKPEMPYTWGLLGSLPRLSLVSGRLEQIPGQPPSLLHPPSGCAFNPRCEFVMDVCRRELPELRASTAPDHRFRCHLDDETRDRIRVAKKAALNPEEHAA